MAHASIVVTFVFTLQGAVAQSDLWPAGAELIFIRHGESTMNLVDYGFTSIKKQACKDVNASSLLSGICSENQKALASLAIRKLAAGSRGSEVPAALVEAAESYLEGRELFDAPLTATGLQSTHPLHDETVEFQSEWMRQHISGEKKGMLVTSNLIRAVDTLLNSMSKLVDHMDLALVTSMQEVSQSGNADPVSIYLPLGLQQMQMPDLAANQQWAAVALERLQHYTRANMTEQPWAPRGGATEDMRWWVNHPPRVVSIGDTTGQLVNHDLYLPNSALPDLKYREVPDAPLRTVRLPGEYLDGSVSCIERFIHFKGFMLKQMRTTPRLILAGHSQWFEKFMAWLINQMHLDESCAYFGRERMRNAAMMRIYGGRCSCLFDGQNLGGDCMRHEQQDTAVTTV